MLVQRRRGEREKEGGRERERERERERGEREVLSLLARKMLMTKRKCVCE